MRLILYSCCFIFLLTLQGFSQSNHSKKHLFNLTAGFGAAGNFFVRSYIENEVPFETSFLKKNFLGKTWHIGLSYPLKRSFEIAAGYSFQEFKRKVQYYTMINNVSFYLDHSIHHINHLADITLRKKFDRKKHLTTAGLGIYYLRPVQEEIAIDHLSNLTQITVQDRNYRNSNLEEAGLLAEGAYEFKFEARVHLGIRFRFFYTVSSGEMESIALYPYIQLQL